MAANTKQGKTLLNMRSANLPSPEAALKAAHQASQSPNLTEDQISVIEAPSEMLNVRLLQSTSDEKQLVLDRASVTDDIQIMDMDDIPEDMRLAGVNPIRPELIATLEFFPAYSHFSWTGVFKALELQYFIRELTRDNVRRFILAFKDEAADKYQEQREKYTVNAAIANNRIYILDKILRTQNAATQALDLKLVLHNNPDFNTYVREMFINVMGFSEAGFEEFSNSKLMCQIIEDLFFMGENYSPGLFGSPPPSRKTDTNATQMHKLHKNKKFAFTRRTLRPWIEDAIDWNNMVDYRQKFVSTLPTSWNDRVKILVTSFSRELINSAQIGALAKESVRMGTDVPKFFASRRPFLYSFGWTGKSAFSKKGPEGSLSSKLMVPNRFRTGVLGEDHGRVLPLEPRGLTAPDKVERISGAEYFVFGPIARAAENGTGQFDVDHFVRWADSFYNLASDVTDYSARFMGLYADGQTGVGAALKNRGYCV